MSKRPTRDLTVGVVFALALIILAVGIMAVGGESRLFVPKIQFRVVFPNTDGLRVGSPVKMAGVEVGTVSSVRLSTDPERAGIEVGVAVDRSFAGRVRQDSQAALRILQLLSGEKFVEITPGSPGAPELPEGSIIEPEASRELLEQAAVTAENLNEITISLRKILGSLERGEGVFGQMISDPEFGKEGLAALHGSLANLRLLTSDMLAGKGFVGRLLYDETFSSKVDTLSATLDDLAAVLADIDLRAGGVGAMLEEDGAGQQAIEDLRAAAGSLRRLTAGLETDRGLLGRLLHDTDYSEGMARDLRRVLSNLAEITDKINDGEGTLGALVNDRTVHDGLEDVVAGLNDSKFARWLLRRYQKRGIELDGSGGQDE